jgi:transposase
MTKCATERSTDGNMRYSQAFLDFLHQINPYKLKFMDESGFRLPDVGKPSYGHSLKEVSCVEIHRYSQSPNDTLFLMIGLNGIMHAKVSGGASDSAKYTHFIYECVNTVTEFGERGLSSGDYLVVDNSPIHHSDVADVLGMWLYHQGIQVVFMPTYSPDFNPTENCFGKIKQILKQQQYRRRLYGENMAAVIYDAVSEVSASDTRGYYRHTGYIHV